LLVDLQNKKNLMFNLFFTFTSRPTASSYSTALYLLMVFVFAQ
jgi:hypothetical protein